MKKYGIYSLKYPLFFTCAYILSFIFYKRLAIFGGILEDDAYFYTQIAYNWGVHNICSFDGINVTSGFHLLWGILLAIVAKIVFIFTANKDTHLLFMLSLYFFIAFYISWEFGKNWIEKIILFFGLLFCTVMTETGLLALLYLIYFRELFIKKEFNRVALMSIMLIPIARIDSTVIVVLSSLYFLFTKQFKIYITVTLMLLLGIAAHFSIMYFLFHHFLSVSSLYKVGSMNVLHIFASNISEGKVLQRFAVFFVMFCLALWGAYKEKKYGYLCVVSAASLFVFVHMFTNQGIRTWYFMPSLSLITVVIFQLSSRYKSAAYALFFIAMAYLTVNHVYYHLVQFKDNLGWQREFIQLVKYNVRPGERIFQIDASGWTGFFSERNVINGDGLVNSYEYYDRSMNNGLKGYLKEYNVHYIITNRDLDKDYIINHCGLLVQRKDVQIVADVPHDIDIDKSSYESYAKFRLFKLVNY